MVPKSRVWLYWMALVTLVAVLAIPSLVYAGGWAVVTLDQLPVNVTAGQPYRLGLMARQHGRTPLQMNEIRLFARQAATGQEVSFTATPEGAPGHYQVDLVFPAAGRWEWDVESGLFPVRQPLPALAVLSAQGTAGAAAPTNAVPRLLTSPNRWLGGVALLALAAGMVLIARGRGRMIFRLAGLGLIVVSGGLVFAFFSSANVEARQAKPVPAVSADVETGRQLFLAKGCVVCHVNGRAVENAAEYSVNVGPELTAYHNDPEYLKKFLADPPKVKAEIGMPNLGLSSAEIEALVAFINSD